MARMHCGHEKELGDTLPAEELERRGILNSPSKDIDPRLQRRMQEAYNDYMQSEFAKLYKLLGGVSHWMDIAGMFHENPYFKMTTRQIDEHKKIRMNQNELHQIIEGIKRLLVHRKQYGIMDKRTEHLSTTASTLGGTMAKSRKYEQEGISGTITVERSPY